VTYSEKIDHSQKIDRILLITVYPFTCRSVLVFIIAYSAQMAEKFQWAKTQPNDGKGENCSD